MDGKKISFGIKLKKTTLIKSDNTNHKELSEKNNVQFIDCLEGSSIKVIGGEDEKVKEPLVIPMKPNKKLLNLEDIVKNNFIVGENDVKDDEINATNKEESQVKPDEKLSLNELAAKELLQGVKNDEIKESKSQRVIETIHPDKLALEGEKESTMDDYETVPIDEFGLAMLRGMGWKEGDGIGKNQKVTAVQQPMIRSKGLGLGADKVTKQNNSKPAVDKEGKPLICCKGAFVKVIAGYHKGTYGQIIGLDDESGRFIIKTTMNNMTLSLNEFLVTPVTKDDYNKNSNVLNNAKYEEYLKKIEQAKNNIKNETNSSDEDRNIKKSIKKERHHSSSDEKDSYSRNKEDRKPTIKEEPISSEDEEKYNKKKNTKSRDKDSSSEDSEDTKRKTKKHWKHEKKYDSSSESSPERNRSSKREKESSKSSKYEDKSSKRSSKRDKKYDSSPETSPDRSRFSRKEDKYSKSSRHDRERSSKYEEKYSKKYNDRSSRKYHRSSKNDVTYSYSRSNKYDSSKSSNKKRRDSSASDEDRYRRKEKSYSSVSEDEARYKKKSHRRDRSAERNSHKSSYKDKERERSRRDKYRK